MADPFYITTAISYPNGPPHIGHAYEAIAADAMARFQRSQGRDVRFQTGTDEHGLKMAQAARSEELEPRAFADRMSRLFREMCDALNVSYDLFIRTSQPDHYRASQAIWTAMEERGDLYLDRYEGWYSVRDEAYYEPDELTSADDGSKLSPQGTPVEWTVEESWFFRLSKYQQPLLDHYAANPEFIRPESRRNEVVRFVEGGLKDLSISRTSFDWGVPVPGSNSHVMYVWLLAGERPFDRQGRGPLPRGLLARVPDERGDRASEAGLRPRLPPQPRREDVEERRQCRRSNGPRRALWGRRAALFPAARSAVRAGRELQRGGDRRAR
jgi:methionyl-tRNA synthetase